MFWSSHSIRRLFLILGATVIMRIVWIVCCKYRSIRRLRSAQNDRMSNVHKELLEALNKLNKDFLALKRGMAMLLANQNNDDRAENYRIYAKLRAREIEEKLKTLRAAFESMCNTNATRLRASLDAALLVQKRDKAKYVQAAELATRELLQLRENVQNQKAACIKYQEDRSKDAKAIFAHFQVSFDDKLFQHEFHTFAKCKAIYEQNGLADKEIRDGIQRMADEQFNRWQEFVKYYPSRCQERFAELEVSLLGRMDNDLSELKHQLDKSACEGTADDIVGYLWRIEGFREKLNLLSEECKPIMCSETFAIGNGLKVRPVLMRITPLNGFVDIQLEFDDVSEDGQAEHSLFLHYRGYSLMCPSSPAADIKFLDRPQFGTKRMMAPYFSYAGISKIHDLQGESKYIQRDQVMLQIFLYPLSFVERYLLEAHDGTVRMCMQYPQIVQDAIPESVWIVSSMFQTEMGYNAQVEVLLNDLGDDNNLYISLAVRFLLGSSDQLLRQPLEGKCTFVLEDQSDSTHKNNIHVERQILFRSDDVQESTPRMVCGGRASWCFLRSVADNEPYMKNDSIVITTTVDDVLAE